MIFIINIIEKALLAIASTRIETNFQLWHLVCIIF